jgi:hypothetical protein
MVLVSLHVGMHVGRVAAVHLLAKLAANQLRGFAAVR